MYRRQGLTAVTADGHHYVFDRYQYLALGSNLHFQSQILDATPDEPFLAFVLQIDLAVVRKVSAEMVGRRGAANHPARRTEPRSAVQSLIEPEWARGEQK